MGGLTPMLPFCIVVWLARRRLKRSQAEGAAFIEVAPGVLISIPDVEVTYSLRD
ncbi:MAG: hypothetical protein JKY49_14000 [Cohaesibacteraceae bacterium]|nr:hypothetical protein [Cohaesibacteraceae bacterium]MBL4877116.1 hypothetical protein [Cohaesibacteraceae bacterium]